MFNEQTADLSGMINGDEKLVVSEAVQKTFMEVNEEGTEAAAATGNLYSFMNFLALLLLQRHVLCLWKFLLVLGFICAWLQDFTNSQQLNY